MRLASRLAAFQATAKPRAHADEDASDDDDDHGADEAVGAEHVDGGVPEVISEESEYRRPDDARCVLWNIEG
jgi:hypothetical protein